MDFTVLKASSDGKLLLKSDSHEPVSKPLKVYFRDKEVATVRETIGLVDSPLYVGLLCEASRKDYESFIGKVLSPDQ